MTTKTLTITEDAYDLLHLQKLKEESFSEEIIRLLSRKKRKTLMDFFGILSEEEGEAMMSGLKERREREIRFRKERVAL